MLPETLRRAANSSLSLLQYCWSFSVCFIQNWATLYRLLFYCSIAVFVSYDMLFICDFGH